jgi:integrase
MQRVIKPVEKVSSKLTITKDFIASVKPTGERQVFRDDKARGLLLRVNGDGSKAWYFDYRDPAGKRQSYKIGDAARIDPGEARKQLKTLGYDPAADRRDKKAEVAQAEAAAEKAAARTIRAFMDEHTGAYWTTHLKLARSGLATKKRILSAWAPLVDTDMAALEVQDAIEHRAERLDDGVAAQTLNRDRVALLALLNQAHAGGLIDTNPLAVPAFKPLKTEDDRRVRYLGMRDEQEDVRDANGNKIGERKRFMDAMAHADTPSYLRDICTLAMNTGLRRGELFKLEWSKVSLQDAQITVTAATAKSGKTRHVVLNEPALTVLRCLVSENEEQVRKAKHEGRPVKLNRFVFVNPDTGKPFTTLKKSWVGWTGRDGVPRPGLMARAHLEDFKFHDLRHDFASRLVQAGVSLYEVKDLLGHSSITLTERYAHLAPHQKRAAVALLEGAA